MRDLIRLVEDGFDWHREHEYGSKIGNLLSDAQALQAELRNLNVAPSIQERLNASMAFVVGYLDNLADHADANLNPLPKRRR